ncbi:MAG: hypothetical protein HRU05_07130 [Oceanospirillaceae bacterium]|nr:hypothetical protein [Oceanospirillaceae bacterium]
MDKRSACAAMVIKTCTALRSLLQGNRVLKIAKEHNYPLILGELNSDVSITIKH